MWLQQQRIVKKNKQSTSDDINTSKARRPQLSKITPTDVYNRIGGSKSNSTLSDKDQKNSGWTMKELNSFDEAKLRCLLKKIQMQPLMVKQKKKIENAEGNLACD